MEKNNNKKNGKNKLIDWFLLVFVLVVSGLLVAQVYLNVIEILH